MNAVDIVNLDPDEWELYRTIRLQALQEEPQAFLSTYQDVVGEPQAKWGERLEAAQEGAHQWLSFAKDGSVLVGMAGAFVGKEPDIAEVISVYVVKEQRGKGISKQLMQHLISTVGKNRVIKKLQLEVNAQQVPAFNLYKSCGFRIIKTGKRKLGDGNEYDEYCMELDLEKNP